MTYLKDAWNKLSIGDPISDAELDAMIAQAEQALPYLESRPDFHLALVPTLHDLNRLRDYKEARKRKR